MTKKLLFWTAVLTIISLWLTVALQSEGGKIAALALRLSFFNILVFAFGLWAFKNKKFDDNTRGLKLGILGPALITTIALGTAQFAPDHLNLTLILVCHLFLIASGNYVTTSSSWLTGIPTFWNVKSSTLWGKSQRFFGYGTIIFGVVSLVISLIIGTVNVPLAFGGLLGLIMLGNIHSWWIWKQSENQGQAKG